MTVKNLKLLPEITYNPVMLLLMCALPQFVLLAVHLSTFNLVQGELNAKERGAHIAIFIVLGICSLSSAALGLVLLKLKKRVNVLMAAVVFVACFGYLWMVLQLLPDLIPESIGDWMISIDELAYNHMALVAPALFYGLILLAGMPLKKAGGKDAAVSVLTVICIPLFWMLIMSTLGSWAWRIDFPVWITIFFVFSTTAVMLLAFLRIMLHVHRRVGGQVWVPVAASLVFPIAGLLLNRAIPFPTDLQDWRIYALTILNAVVLSIPFVKGQVGGWLWFARVATFPFSIYFFILFLPFLPLSIPAMLAAGGGFLILAPTLLFVVHSRRLMSEGRILISRIGILRTTALMVVALSLLPGGYVLCAKMHKKALSSAINAVYHPDYAESDSGLNLSQTKAALTRLHKMKSGVYAPLLSEVYDSIVFDGMVLPDHKLEQMEIILFGEAIEVKDDGRSFELFSFIGSSRNRRQNWSNGLPPAKTVEIKNIAVSSVTNGSLVEAEVVLTLKNSGTRQSEFVTAIHLPDSVAVSGYWLDVEGEHVQGQVFDRKTALWIFHMIRDSTRRDPGIVHYVDDDTLELRVFPFATNQTRSCAIKFLYPRGLLPNISIGSQKVEMPVVLSGVKTILAGTELTTGLFLPVGKGLPGILREPYFHIMVDASGVNSLPLVAEKIERMLQAHPEVKWIKIDLVNHETVYVGTGYLDRTNWRSALDVALADITPSGGFWLERAINHVLLNRKKADDILEMMPLFILMSDQAIEVSNLDLIPDLSPDIIIATPETLPESIVIRQVHALRCGDKIKFVESGVGGMSAFLAKDTIEIYDRIEGWSAVKPGVTMLNESRYSKLIAMRAIEESMESYPYLADDFRGEILVLSKDSGILSSHTALIVVENSAQWEMLKRKEEDAMKADSALEFDEFQEVHVTPEPATWLLLCIGIPILFLHRFVKRRKQVTVQL